MSQDTRKDPRAKVLTMTVRYKSATLDEFIEHHSYDVSRGGMFIKTPSPFPPGTLLKFEVKIAADQKVIQGVGRVVWKREGESTADARPAGMGVKFIKLDDASRKVIDTLVESRGDASSAYEAGGGDTGVPAPAAAITTSGAKAPATAAEAPRAPNPRKATMIGLGAMNASNRPPVVAATPEKPAASFFPETNSQAEMPAPEDRTVMKQAAELLQDALREAGGSMAEVGSSSKYDDPPAKSAAAKASAAEPAPREEPVAKAVEAKPASVKPAAASVKPAPASVRPAAAVSKSTIPATRKGAAAAVPARRVSVPAAAAPAASSNGGGGRIVVIALVIAATGGLVYAFSTGKPPAPTPAASAEPAPSAAPSAAPVAVDSALPAPAESVAPVDSAAPAASASAAVAASASVAPAVSAPPPAAVAPVVVPPKPVLQALPKPKPKPAPVVAPTEPTEPTPPSEPTVAAPTQPTAPTTPKPEAPAPKPKPAEPAGDNPY